MITDRFLSLSQDKLFLSKNAEISGFEDICKSFFQNCFSESGEIKKAEGIIGIPEGLKKKIKEIFETDYEKSVDGYIIISENHEVKIYSESERGLMFGAANLAQRLKTGMGEGIIYNYPKSDFRMIKLYLPSKENIPFFKNFIDLCVYYGYNTIMLELGGAMEYKSHPEINDGWREYSRITSEHINHKSDNDYFPFKDKDTYYLKNSIHCENGGKDVLSREQISDIIKYLKKRHFEIIPEVPSLSHCDYLLTKHGELAERKDDLFPDTYCPSNPETYKILFDILKEIAELFKPERINIGHDEAYSIGLCEECRKKEPYRIFAEDIIKIHDYLKGLGIKTMMWSDKLINCIDKTGVAWAGARREIKNPNTGELCQVILPTYKAIDLIPNDIELLHWYWSLEENTEKDFIKRGFKTYFANFEPLRVKNVIKRLKSGMGGIGISNWSGVDKLHLQRNGIYFDLAMSAMIMWSNDYKEENVDFNIKSVSEDLYSYRMSGAKYYAEVSHALKKDIPFVLYLDGYEVDEKSNILGSYCIEYSDGSKEEIPVEYGKTVGYIGVNRNYKNSSWCESYETDRRIIEPCYSCRIDFDGEKTYYCFGISLKKHAQRVYIDLKDEYKELVEMKEIKIFG